VRRFSQISRVLVRHGFGFVFDVRRGRRQSLGAQEILGPNFGVRLRRTLEDLGPTFIKFGQLLSSRSDVLPEGVLAEMERLQDATSPLSVEVVRRVIERELGAPVEELFESFEPVELGSASIGQVHRATLAVGDGEDGGEGVKDVAVKVQRPEARGRVEDDLALMRDLASFIHHRFGDRTVVDVRGLVAEFEVVIQRELDYGSEARNARRFAANFADTPVVIPGVYTEYSTGRVLTMEYVGGTRFHDITPLSLLPAERRRVAGMGAEAIFKMAFEDGFFHGDPHAGNLILTPEGNLALLDFGMVDYMSRGDIDALGRLFVSVIQQDAEATLRGLEDLGIRYSAHVRSALVQDLREFLYKYAGLSVGEVTISQALGELISLARRNRVSMPPVFSLMTRALATAEGLARSIDPSLNVYEVARPYARRLLRGRYSPRAVQDRGRERALEYARYAEDYPRQIRQVLAELSDGEMQVRLKHGGLDELTGEVDVLANRLVFALITGALLIGSSMLGAFDRGGPRVPVLGVPLVAFAGFSIALVLGGLLLLLILRDRRI
jgi:ubiquinone biosynthesis protein